MKLPRWVLVSLFTCLFLTTLIAKSQVMVYGTIAVTDYGYKINGGNLIINGDHPGLGFGGTFDFLRKGRLHLGVDARGGISPSAYGGDKAIGSVRVSFVPVRTRLSPYFQLGGGVFQTKLPAQSNTVQAQTFTDAGIDLAGGVDLRLTDSLDWRLVDLEDGASVGRNQVTGGASIGTGIVYHFHPAQPKKP